MSKKTLYLVDGTALCYRSFFALKLSTSIGLPVGAVYGFYRTLKKIISKYDPSYVGVCFDVSRKTFRHKKFKEYKINRPPLPDDLKLQIPLIKKLVTSLGIKIIERQGFEADDVIASLCQKALKNNLSVVIVSPDKDLCQLIEADKAGNQEEVSRIRGRLLELERHRQSSFSSFGLGSLKERFTTPGVPVPASRQQIRGR